MLLVDSPKCVSNKIGRNEMGMMRGEHYGCYGRQVIQDNWELLGLQKVVLWVFTSDGSLMFSFFNYEEDL